VEFVTHGPTQILQRDSFFSVLDHNCKCKNKHWILSLHWRHPHFMDCWKGLIKRCRVKLSFILASEVSWKRWLVRKACCRTYLLYLASAATEWYQGVWICCFSSFIHTTYFFNFIYIWKRSHRGFFKREASNTNKCFNSREAR